MPSRELRARRKKQTRMNEWAKQKQEADEKRRKKKKKRNCGDLDQDLKHVVGVFIPNKLPMCFTLVTFALLLVRFLFFFWGGLFISFSLSFSCLRKVRNHRNSARAVVERGGRGAHERMRQTDVLELLPGPTLVQTGSNSTAEAPENTRTQRLALRSTATYENPHLVTVWIPSFRRRPSDSSVVLLSPGLFFHQQRAIKSTKLKLFFFYDEHYLFLFFCFPYDWSVPQLCVTARGRRFAKHSRNFASRWPHSGLIQLTTRPHFVLDSVFLLAEGIETATQMTNHDRGLQKIACDVQNIPRCCNGLRRKFCFFSDFLSFLKIQRTQHDETTWNQILLLFFLSDIKRQITCFRSPLNCLWSVSEELPTLNFYDIWDARDGGDSKTDHHSVNKSENHAIGGVETTSSKNWVEVMKSHIQLLTQHYGREATWSLQLVFRDRITRSTRSK